MPLDEIKISLIATNSSSTLDINCSKFANRVECSFNMAECSFNIAVCSIRMMECCFNIFECSSKRAEFSYTRFEISLSTRKVAVWLSKVVPIISSSRLTRIFCVSIFVEPSNIQSLQMRLA